MGVPNTFPYELIGPGFKLYWAVAATPIPGVDDEVDTLVWNLIGKNGNKSYAEEGVRINLPQTVNAFRGYGSAGVLKEFRDQEDVIVQVTIADLRLETLSLALNSNDVTETANRRCVGLSRGLTVDTVALLARGPSPYFNDGYSQWYLPYASNHSSPEIAFRKPEAAIFQLEWRAIVDPEAAEGEELGVLEGDDGLS